MKVGQPLTLTARTVTRRRRCRVRAAGFGAAAPTGAAAAGARQRHPARRTWWPRRARRGPLRRAMPRRRRGSRSSRSLGAPSFRLLRPASPSANHSAFTRRVVRLARRGQGHLHARSRSKSVEDTREGANGPWAPRWQNLRPPAGRCKWVAQATFSEPGTYVLRCSAPHDGALTRPTTT